MKKKLFGILTLLFLVATCFSFAACGKKSDPQFHVYYAYSADSQNWQDGTNGINCFYGEGENFLHTDENGWAEIYIKVDVTNAKNVDNLVITNLTTSNGTTFRSATVKKNEVFKIPVTGIVPLTLKILETNSQISTQVDINVSNLLEGIEADCSVKPAVMVGGSVNLAEFKNRLLKFLPVDKNGNSLTYQTNVGYRITNFGSFDGANNFVDVKDANLKSRLLQNVHIDNSILRVDSTYEFKTNTYAIEVEVFSLDRPELDAGTQKFYVYVAENVQTAPSVKYAASDSVVTEPITLYHSLTNAQYSHVELKVENLYQGPYSNPIKTADGEACYIVKLYNEQTNQPIEFGQLLNAQGLQFDYDANMDEYKITLISFKNLTDFKVRYALELEGLDFGSTTNLNNSTTITLNQKLLPTALKVNDAELNGTDGHNSFDANIYSIKGQQQTLKLNLSIVNNINNAQQILVDSANAFDLKDADNKKINSGGFVKNNSVLNVLFAANDVAHSSFELKVRVNPETFNGQPTTAEYITITINVNLIVSADSVKIYKDANYAAPITANNTIDVGVGVQNFAYLRVYYTGVNFDPSSVSLFVNSENIKFANNSDNLLISELSATRTGQKDGDGSYNEYSVELKNVNDLENAIVNITIAGKISSSFKISAKNLSNGEFSVDTSVKTEQNAYKIDGVNNGHTNFAIVYGKTVNFTIQGKDVLNRAKDVIYSIQRQEFSNEGLEHFADDAVRIGSLSHTNQEVKTSTFAVFGARENLTQIVKIAVNYYAKKDGYVQLVTGEALTLEFAVYVPVNEVEVELNYAAGDVDALTFIGEPSGAAQKYARATINYVAKSILENKAPSTVLYFNNGENVLQYKNPNKINVELSQSLEKYNIEVNYNNLDESHDFSRAILTSLSGNIDIMLTAEASIDALEFKFRATNFGIETGNASYITVHFQTCAVADGVEVSGADLVLEGNDLYYLNISYLNAEQGIIEKHFNATASYLNTNSNTFKLKELGYSLTKLEIVNNEVHEFPFVNDDSIIVDLQNANESKIIAHKTQNGGIYRLDIFALDSYTQEGTYTATSSLYLRISDGTKANPYTISSQEEFEKIGKNENLNSNFIIAQDFEVENSIVGEFKGSLSGLSQLVDNSNTLYVSKHTLTVNLKNINAQDPNNFIALFQKIGSGAVVENLNLVVKFDVNNLTSTTGDIFVGALAGINEGSIKNVGVSLADVSSLTFEKLSLEQNNLYFGLLVGQNNGNIDMASSNVTASNLTILLTQKSNYNIGLIAGENNGAILGEYLGKESLDSVSYTVLSNLTIYTNGANLDNTTINVGAVAGVNKKSISQVIVGGKIEINGSEANVEANLGGIAGNALAGGGAEYKGIKQVAVLGLDLTNNLGAVAGIVAKSSGMDIFDVRVISTKVTFGFNYTSSGKIYGTDVVAGIVANSDNDTITYAALENFNAAGEDDFYTLESETNKAASFVYTANNTKIYSSFANINLANNAGENNLILTSPTTVTETGTYFVGKIQNFDESSNYILNEKTNYVVVYSGNEFYYKSANNEIELFNQYTSLLGNALFTSSAGEHKYQKFDNVYLPTDDGEFALRYDIENIYKKLSDGQYQQIKDESIEANGTYYVKIDWQTFLTTQLTIGVDWQGNIGTIENLDTKFEYAVGNNVILNEYYLPYLVKQGEQVRIIKPTAIKATFNADYVIYINSVVLDKNQDSNFDIPDYNISQILLVDYFEFEDSRSAVEYNTHYLVNKERFVNGTAETSGLIDLSVSNQSETEVDGGVKFEIVKGRDIAYLTPDGERIVFTGVGNDPVVVRAYSLFNQTAESYFAFFVQYGISKLNLTSNSNNLISSVEKDVDYELTLHTGSNPIELTVGAENIFKSQKFKSIFDGALANHLKLSVNGSEHSILNLVTSEKSVRVSIKEGTSFELSTNENVELSIYLDLTNYYGKNYFPQTDGENQIKLLGKINLLVTAYKATEKIETNIVAKQADSESHVKFNVNLITGYIKENDDENYILSNKLIIEDNVVKFNETNKDSLVLTFNKTESDALTALLDATGVSIANLFDYTISYTYLKEGETVKGYTYSIELSLKNEFKYRYLQDNINLSITITSALNPNATSKDLCANVELTFKPTELKSARFFNYEVTSFDKSSAEVVSINSTETSYISPAEGFGSVMVIYLEPTYAHIKSATLSSNTVDGISLLFTQLVYNPRTGSFANLPYADSNHVSELHLDPNKNLKTNWLGGDNYEYDGKIFVRVNVSEEINGSKVLTSTLSVDVGKDEPIVREKQLITEYLPGVALEYDNEARIGDGYLIQEETINPVTITLYGYELNNTPDISFVWNLDKENTGFRYKTDANNNDILTIIIDDKGNEYNINNYVRHGTLKDYTNLTQNSDGSYSYSFNIYTSKNIPASFKLTAKLSFAGNESETKELIFYPVDYILKGVYVNNLNNGNLNTVINDTTRIDLTFLTNNLNNDLSNTIYSDLIKQFENEQAFAHAFSYSIANFGTGHFDDSAISQFLIRYGNGHIYLTGLSEVEARIQLRIGYSYKKVNGRYQVEFGLGDTGDYTLTYNFNLIIRSGTNEAAPIRISNEDEFVQKLTNGANVDFILMNDIDLYNYTPFEANFASLDGNNKVITIHSFNVGASNDGSVAKYGLFTSIGSYTPAGDEGELKSTTLKNIIVDYGELEDLTIIKTDAISSVVFGGLVATVEEGGIIYNCDVINFSGATKNVNINLNGFVGAEVLFGGLVGENSGVITNSRVGRNSYDKISLNAVTQINESVVKISAYPINFVLGGASVNENDTTINGFIGIAGGFVGENNGVIASSYFANAGLTNYSKVETETNLTAGFVAVNNGEIRYSYVKALENTIQNVDEVRSTGMQIRSMGNGNVAGFVYNNLGEISDCFANTELYTDSALLAGFVYRNELGASISTSYAACTLNAAHDPSEDQKYSYAEQPFVGVDEHQQLLSFGELKNCYYLEPGYSSFNIKEGKPNASALSKENFRSSNNLNGFVFINSSRRQESDLGIWTYYTMDTNELHALPELTSANQIAYSYRYLVAEEENVFANAPSYALGSKNNPYIIRTADEYNIVMTGVTGDDELGDRLKERTGYIRLVNDISFVAQNQQRKDTAILTRADFTFGDKLNPDNITSFEGNGMTISGISLDVIEDNSLTNTNLEKVGLFGEIYNAYIKNLNLEFKQFEQTDVSSNPTAPIKYSGGLAGTIDNSTLINLKLDGNATTLSGKNFVGGVAGIISGRSLLYNLEVNINVVSDSNLPSGMYYNKNDFAKMMVALGKLDQSEVNNSDTLNAKYNEYLESLSYAGGVAGVLDLTKRTDGENLSLITVDAANMATRTSGNIEAGFAGGIAGYASADTDALRLKVYVGANTKIYGSEAVGGLFGVGLGRITASQVTAREADSQQYAFDDAFGEYIKNLANNENATLNLEQVGNTTLLKSQGYAGGLIGIGIATRIESSYAKSSVELAKTFGGLIGLSVGTTTFHSYAVPYVNLDNTLISKVGGLIGEAASIQNNSTTNIEYVRYAIDCLHTQTPKYTDLAYTFSTILLNNQQLKNILAGEIVDESNQEVVDINTKTLDYLVADYMADGVCQVYSNDNPINTSETLNVFVGRANYANLDEENEVVKYSYGEFFALNEIYETDTSNSAQAELFNQVFSDWPTQYWLLNEARYFPLLIKEDVGNFVELREAKDLDILVANPSLNYRVMNDIDISEWEHPNSNWIFNVEFTGVLEGYLGENEDVTALPRIYNLNLSTTENNTSGLFRKTLHATIRNLDFVWTPNSNNNSTSAIVINHNISTIGGLTCEDSKSKFNNVGVYVGNYNKYDREILSGADYNLVNNSANYYNPIEGFGGLVGIAKDTTIDGCEFNGNVVAKMNATNIYFGGLVGKGEKTYGDYDDDDDEYEEEESRFSTNKFLVRDSYVGNDENIDTKFTISINGYNSAYIGGAFGHVEGAAISEIHVGNNEKDTGRRRISMDVSLNGGSGNAHLGGLIAYADDSSLSSSEALTDLVASSNYSAESGATLNVAGLIGRYGGTQAVRNSVVETAMNLTNLNIANLRVSGGIAELYTSGDTHLEQNLFIGEINSEGANTISNVYAGGALACLNGDSANLTINETFTNVKMTIGSNDVDDVRLGTVNIYAGGLVGDVSNVVNITNSLSAGQIIPLTSESAQNILVGGVVGRASKADISYLISTSSILLDSIASKAIANLDVHAILGNVNSEKEASLTLNNVYYSSDISLMPEELCQNATNISAYALVHPYADANWVQDLTMSGSWQVLNQGLPYIANLENKLTTYKVLTYNDFGEISGYVLGSSLNPIEITAQDLETGSDKITNEYNYYILTENTVSNTILSSGIDLNGVLIASDNEFIFTPSGNCNIFLSIGLHSAVSNLHIKVADGTNLRLNNGGLIANENDGVIFNCSVQGAELGVEAYYAGLLTGSNNGIISYSYSAAEIVELNASEFAGICYSNQGKILSCYFNGYINNITTAAAGIVCELGENSYIYNCYMAGVLTTIANNSFSLYSLKNLGANNYVDLNANKKADSETTDVAVAGDIVNWQTINTQFLMANEKENEPLLEGNWFTTVRKTSDNQYYVDLSASTYGYNYLYPIYNFNKHNADMQLMIKDYALYTGTGVDNYSVDLDGDLSYLSNNDHLESIEKLMSEEDENSTLYLHALKVPHLGVLKAIQGIANTVVEDDKPIKTNFNYVLIYDINGEVENDGGATENYSWQAVGSSAGQTDEDGFYHADAEFNGLFISNKYYNFTKNLDETTTHKMDNLCTIQNLSGEGLFTNINNAYLGYVVFGNMTDLNNSGALGVSVNKAGQVYVDNVYYLENATFSGAKGGGYVSAMFGTIENAGTITIQDSGFMQNLKDKTDKVVMSNAGNAGFIVGRFNGGQINFVGGNNLRIAFSGTINFAGGLVGELRNGTINGATSGSAVTILDNDATELTSNLKLGGIVGRAVGEVAQSGQGSIKSITAYFAQTITTSGLGGLVYGAENSTIIFDGCSVQLDEATTFKPKLINTSSNSYFGLVCASLTVEEGGMGGVKAYNFSITQNLTAEIELSRITTYTSDNIQQTSNGFGGLAGYMKGGVLTVSATDRVNPTIKVRAANVGGLVGCYEGGALALESDIQYLATIYGYYNVGGAMGYCSADVSQAVAEFVDIENKIGQNLNFLNSSKAVATLKTFDDVSDIATTLKLYNWGGMFGYLNKAGAQNVTNYNTIEINPFAVNENYYKQASNPTIYNVGGVAGKATSAEFANLSNAGKISTKTNDSTTTADEEGIYRAVAKDSGKFDIFEFSVGSYAFDGGGRYYFAPLVNNLGGVFGLCDEGTIVGASNSAEIMGYQNVGGLVGQANNATISQASAAANNVTSNIIGVVNVGGAIGLLKGETSSVTAKVQANVYGNYNVGGLVGHLAGGTIDNSFVGFDTAGSQQNEIKGIYFKTLHYVAIPLGISGVSAGQFNRSASFLPTNVGGVVGSTGSNAKITNTTISNALITSSSEGAFGEYKQEDGEESNSLVKSFNSTTTISTVSNPMLYNNETGEPAERNLKQLVNIPNSTEFTKDNQGEIISTYYVNFNNMTTGFGGFAGSIDSKSILEQISTNEMQNVSVYAMLGINAGSIFGAYNVNSTKTSEGGAVHTIETPTLLSDLYVEGAYNIGGIAGYIYTSIGVDSIRFETDMSEGFVHATSGARLTIHVQSHKQQGEGAPDSLVGIYVGGLFGKVKGYANGLKINGANSLKIDMNANNTYYAGGLIGRLEGNLGQDNSTLDSNIVNGAPANADTEAPDFSSSNAPFTIHGDDKTNFGGLVGMLKKTSGTNESANVIGWQPYAFTVNTIENSNYADGETTYDYNDADDNDLYLIAQAYYVNQDSFNISYSRGGASVVGADVTTNSSRWFGQNSDNPLYARGSTFGWARDYTMFKTMQRNIPQSDNNGAAWDAISVVYDASNITYVATGANAERNIGDGTTKGWYGEEITEAAANEILYSYEPTTVTDEGGGNPQTIAAPISLWDKFVELYGEGNALNKIKEHIFFTIYEFGEDNPILYSRMGIARALTDEKGKFITQAPESNLYALSSPNTDYKFAIFGGQVYYDLKKGAATSNFKSGMNTNEITYNIKPEATDTLTYLPWYYENVTLSNVESGWWIFKDSNAEINNRTYGILETSNVLVQPYKIAGNNVDVDGNAKIYHHWDESNHDWSEAMPLNDDFLNLIHFQTSQLLGVRNDLSQYDITWNISSNQTTKINRQANFVYNITNSPYGDVWFSFETVFENWTTNKSGENAHTNENLSDDGSVLNIMGLVSSDAYNKLHQRGTVPDDITTGWESVKNFFIMMWEFIAIAAISVGIFIATGGTGAVAIIAAVISVISAIAANGFLITTVVMGVIQHNKVQNMGRTLVLMKTLEDRKDLSFGLFAETYSREIKYVQNADGDWVLKAQVDSSIEYEDEHISGIDSPGALPYMYYSSTRPADFYQGYYIVAVKNDTTTGSVDSLSDLFEKVPKKDVTINAAGKYEYCGSDEKFVGKDLIILKTYVYQNGMYYISSFASTNVYTPSQDFAYNIFNGESEFNASQFTENSGIYYVQGAYSNGSYTLPEADLTGNFLSWEGEGNNIKNSNSTGAGVDLDAFAEKVGAPFIYEDTTLKFVPVSADDVGDQRTNRYGSENISEGYLIDREVQAELSTSSGETSSSLLNKAKLYLGYGYMTNAYYTIQGNYMGDAYRKSATFNASRTQPEGGVEGVTWFSKFYPQATDDDGRVTTEAQTWYFTLQSISDYSSGGSYTSVDRPTSEGQVIIALYPYSFTNPGYEDSLISAAQDNNYYIFSESGDGISHTATYFYYDGGYKVGSYSNPDGLDANGSGIIFTKTGKVSQSDYGGLDSDNLGSISIDLYDASGNTISVTLFELAQDLAKGNNSTYKDNYYLTNSTNDMYKVVNNYQVEQNDIILKYDDDREDETIEAYDIYSVNMEYVVKDGVLMNVDVNFATANDEDFNRNKYLMNSALQIYTRYKFTEGEAPWTNGEKSGNENLFAQGQWVKISDTEYKYFLFNNRANPNSGSRNTTYLTESLLVTLGGGKNVKTSTSGNASTPSGTFNAK